MDDLITALGEALQLLAKQRVADALSPPDRAVLARIEAVHASYQQGPSPEALRVFEARRPTFDRLYRRLADQ
ncbi:hypothetical protein [Zavarzinia sp. CC-PAN008]|uniref:hypothetical protein n=1 Tax=Zavarzinia sp. CC-PAN008 TaxID=3243332 RepID=UPI003F7445E6